MDTESSWFEARLRMVKEQIEQRGIRDPRPTSHARSATAPFCSRRRATLCI